MLKTVSLLREMNRDFKYNEDISENEHGFEDDQVHIDEENSGNISECSDEDNNIINEQENDNNPEALPLIINDLGVAIKTSEVLGGRIISDRGTCFTSKAFNEYCVSNGITHSLISVRHPQANGQVERANATLVPMIQASMRTDKTWDTELQRVESQLNNSVNKTIGDTPFHALFGYYANSNDEALARLVDNDQTWINSVSLQSRIRNSIIKEHELWKIKYNAKNTNVTYSVGEIIYLKRTPEYTGQPTKLQPKYRGPLVITQTLPGDTYRLQELLQHSGHQYCTTAHVFDLKSYHLPIDDDEDQDEALEDQKQENEQDEEGEYQTEQPEDVTVGNSPTEQVQVVKSLRPQRLARKPTYLVDYDLK
ncbi:hypothetical protein QTP88_013782 [Uroleucon formosanum]